MTENPPPSNSAGLDHVLAVRLHHCPDCCKCRCSPVSILSFGYLVFLRCTHIAHQVWNAPLEEPHPIKCRKYETGRIKIRDKQEDPGIWMALETGSSRSPALGVGITGNWDLFKLVSVTLFVTNCKSKGAITFRCKFYGFVVCCFAVTLDQYKHHKPLRLFT